MPPKTKPPRAGTRGGFKQCAETFPSKDRFRSSFFNKHSARATRRILLHPPQPPTWCRFTTAKTALDTY